jgi:DNA-binding winged helix-turn-helix (wHTH) protein/Tfp pilus assembly protein PilF
MRELRLHDRLVLPELNAIAVRGASVHVEPKVMELLLELAKHAGEVISKEHIIQSVWGGAFVCEDVVPNAVSSLRRALGDKARNPRLIETIPKRGYRLVPEAISAQAVEPNAAREIANACSANSQSDAARVLSDSAGEWHDLKRSILRVRYLRHEETIASLSSACAYCEEVIRQEPNCAAAHAELALTLFLLEKLGAVRREDNEQRVRRAVDGALRADERAGITLVCVAKQEYRYDWKWESAEQHFRQALAADPTNADAFSEFSLLLSIQRRFHESLKYIEQACLLDPLSPAARLQAGHANYSSGRWSVAAQHYRRVLRFTPQHVFARWGLADSLARSDKPHEAIAVLEEGLSMPSGKEHPLLLTSMSRIQIDVQPAGRGFVAFARSQPQTSDPVLLAELYGSIGETATAFKHLNEAADIAHYRLSAVNMFPQFAPLRSDARYGQFLKRIGLRG